MIISKIDGGLGNQLFQYAFAYATAKKNNDTLLIENHALHYRNREFMLNKMNISAKRILLPSAKKNNKILKLIAALQRRSILLGKYKAKWTIEDTKDYFTFNSSYQNRCKSNQYYVGFYQNPDYFSEFENDLRLEFKVFDEFVSSYARKVINQIKEENSVAIHIRKGDYPEGWLVNPQFYHIAINDILNRVKNAKLYVFCEDLEYAKEIIGEIGYPVAYISDLHKFTDLEEFEIMRACNNNITSNSTFSWWAAYLNDNPKKIVISPVTKMFKKTFYPESWDVIDTMKSLVLV